MRWQGRRGSDNIEDRRRMGLGGAGGLGLGGVVLVLLVGYFFGIDVSPLLETARLLYEGPWVAERNAAVGAISITHTRTQVFAVAARVARLGVDLVDHDDARLDRIAERFLPGETAAIERYTERLLADGYDGLARALTGDEREAIARDDARRRARAMCFAATEAGLKALGLGLLDGGVIDSASPVRVADLDPPCFAPLPAPAEPLALVLHDVGFSILAIAYA